MEPLQSIPMPAHGVLVAIDTTNSWQAGSPEQPFRLAYIATNSTARLSFVSLQSAPNPANVLRLASRPSRFDDMPYGAVIEVYLAKDIDDGETVYLAFAQTGATAYYPPQQIDDAP